MRAHGAKLWAPGHSVIHREGRGHLQVSSGPEAWTGASGATDGFPVTSWSESRRRPLDRLRQGPRRAAGKLRPAGACRRGTLGSSHSTVCLGMSSAGRARAPLCPNLASPLCDLQTAASASSTGASPSCRGRHKSPETMLTGSQGAPRGLQCEVSSQGPLRAQESPERGWLLSP